MHCLGLEVDGSAPCKTKMANNTNVRCVGVIKALKVKTLGTKVIVDVFVMPTKGEGYPMILPMILGRPWLMAMKEKKRLGHRSDQAPRTQRQGDLLQHEDKKSTRARSQGFKG